MQKVAFQRSQSSVSCPTTGSSIRTFCCFGRRRYQQAELQNGRWAMLGTAGVLFPEILSNAGTGGPAAQQAWCAFRSPFFARFT